MSDNTGRIITTFTDLVSTLYGPFGVIGRTIVLHQLEDDLGLKNDTGSKTTGNAGAVTLKNISFSKLRFFFIFANFFLGNRIACGTIGITV
jgi:Cu/Zn superoxide dismutase